MAHATQTSGLTLQSPTTTTNTTALPATFDLFILYVSDWTKAIAFYRDTMGWTLKFEEPNSWAEFNTGGIRFALHPTDKGQTPKPMDTHLCFSTTDVDATVKALTTRGVKIVSQPRDVCDGIRSATFADPFGNTFSFHGK